MALVMEEWKGYRLGDLVNFQNGYAFKSTDFTSNVGYKVIRIKELKNGLVKFFDDTVSVIQDTNKTMSKFLVNKGDIIFALTGDPVNKPNPDSWVGRVSLYTHNEIAYLNQRTCKITNYREIVPKYIYYYFRCFNNLHSLASKATGSANQVNISTKIIEDTNIFLPSLNIQNIVVNILSSLDDKIELNCRINENLEQQAQALFNYYFIEHCEILGDYERGNLTEIANYTNGLPMQKFRPQDGENGIPVLKIKELGQGQTDNSSDICSGNIADEYKVTNGDIIFSWSGTLMVKAWCGGLCGLNQHLFKVTSEKYPKWYYYFWTKFHLNKFIRIAQDKAVTMGHIRRNDLETSEVLIPKMDALTKIDNIINPIFNQIIEMKCENNNLAELRDTLLPKLMSGDIIINKI